MLHNISLYPQIKIFDEDYLKHNYKMYVVDEKGRKSNDTVIFENKLDYGKVVFKVFSRDDSGNKFHDTEIDWTVLYFCSDDQKLVKKIKSLVDVASEKVLIPEGKVVDEYFKPIFKDLARNAGFLDPFQEIYNRDFMKQFETFLYNLEFVDKSSIPQESQKENSKGFSFLYSTLYNFKYKNGIDSQIVIHFNPMDINSIQLNPETFLKTGKQHYLNDEFIEALNSEFNLKTKARDNLQKLVSSLLNEFTFLKSRFVEDSTRTYAQVLIEFY